MKGNRLLKWGFAVVLALQLSACAHNDYPSTTSGLLEGIGHGFVFLFALIAQLLGYSTELYATNNTGIFYWAGFTLGLLVWPVIGRFLKR